jgi:hypothetical protein
LTRAAAVRDADRIPHVRALDWLLTHARTLRHPQLFLLVLGLFALNLVIPDPMPLLDEALLGLMTLLLGTWRGERTPQPPPPPGARQEKDVTPR